MSEPRPRNPNRKISVRNFAYFLPFLLVYLSGCGPAATVNIPPGSIEPTQTPPTSSPIYTNKPLSMTFNYFPGLDKNVYGNKTQVNVNASVESQSGNSSSQNITHQLLERSQSDKKAGNYPIQIDFQSQEEGKYTIVIQGQDCLVNTDQCGPWTNYNVDVVYDTTAPQIINLADPTSAIDTTVSGQTSDNLSPVDVTVAGCDGQNQNTAAANDQGVFSVSFKPTIGDNCLTVQAVDRAGNASAATTLNRNYDLNTGLTVDAVQQGQTLYVYGNLPDNVDPSALQISGDQSIWRFFGFRGHFDCSQVDPQGGFDYTVQCQLPEEKGSPVKVHINFVDPYGNSYDVYYKDSSDRIFQVQDASLADKALAVASTVGVPIALTALTLMTSALYLKNKVRSKSRKQVRAKVEDLCHSYNYDQAIVVLKNEGAGLFNLADEIARLNARRFAHTKERMIFIFQGTSARPERAGDFEKNLVQGIDGFNYLLKSGYVTNNTEKAKKEREEVMGLFRVFLGRLTQWIKFNFFDGSAFKKWEEIKQEQSFGYAKPDVLKKILDFQIRPEYRELWANISQGAPDHIPLLNEVAIIQAAVSGLLQNGTCKHYLMKATPYQRSGSAVATILANRGLNEEAYKFVTSFHTAAEKLEAIDGLAAAGDFDHVRKVLESIPDSGTNIITLKQKIIGKLIKTVALEIHEYIFESLPSQKKLDETLIEERIKLALKSRIGFEYYLSDLVGEVSRLNAILISS